jgi:hypothetical protein
MRKPWLAVPLLALGGCGDKELPGDYWSIAVDGVENACTGGGAEYHQDYEYRVLFEGNDITVAIGEDIWATGVVEGCTLTYTSLVWSDYREDLEIEWEILGNSQVNVGGGGGCVDGTDWLGTETFIVTSSAHPDVQPGCTYTLDVTGEYLKNIPLKGGDAAEGEE